MDEAGFEPATCALLSEVSSPVMSPVQIIAINKDICCFNGDISNLFMIKPEKRQLQFVNIEEVGLLAQCSSAWLFHQGLN